MDLSEEKACEDLQSLAANIPVLSDYVKGLESHVKSRYLQKISVVGVDPASIPSDQFDPECLPQIESTDLLAYLVLETSHYTKDQFKAYKSLEAYNQMVSGFVTSVRGLMISGKCVVVAKVRHSQRMNDPLVNIWIIADKDGTILSAHCLNCKAGLAESCSHVASVLFYIEAWNRIHGKLACTQVKCSWLLPTYVNEVEYKRVKDIDFRSAKKLKESLDKKIDSLSNATTPPQQYASEQGRKTPLNVDARPSSTAEMSAFFDKLNQCNVKPVALSLTKDYADQFVAKSRSVPVVSDLFETVNLELQYPELLRKCVNVQLDISNEDISKVELDTRSQAKGSGFFRHRAGRIGASVSGAVCHCNLAQPPQSLIKGICYPHLFKVSTKATRHGCIHEDDAIKAYEVEMQKSHVNFQLTRCGLFINEQHPFLHATPDFLTSCDCCGLGCGEVKCPICIGEDCDFDKYVTKKNTCLEKVNGNFQLVRNHNYYYQVQQQLFTLKERKFCDFVVCGIDSEKKAHIVKERIYPDAKHWGNALPKLEAFWRICILPEILGRWYTRRCTLPVPKPDVNGICFCRVQRDEEVISCSNNDCPYVQFHRSCLALDSVKISKKWYCPHCSRLPQFKRGKKAKQSAQSTPVIQGALNCDTICTCQSKPNSTDKLLECHGATCKSGKYFHLHCLNLKRMPNNAKTTWKCAGCKKANASATATTTCISSSAITTSASSTVLSSESSTSVDNVSAFSNEDDDVTFVQEKKGKINKQSPLAILEESDYQLILNPLGWLNCDIIHMAQVLLHEAKPSIEGFQRPTLGPARNFDVVSAEFIQLLHTGNDHWVCISSIGCVPGYVNLYDSLFHDIISEEVEDQTNDLLGGSLVGLNFVPVQQQSNGSDCGVFAIAFATCLVLETDPRQVTFDVNGIRHHLASCLRNRAISMFPCL